MQTEIDQYYREVPLSNGMVALVDAADWPLVSQYKWHYHDGYAARYTSVAEGKRGRIFMHRLIMGVDDPSVEVDHINMQRHDCRGENL